MAPLFTAVSPSARQILLLLRCISFAKKAQIRISPSGIRLTAGEGSAMEAFVVLEKSLFTTYTYNPQTARTSQEETDDGPLFEVSLAALLETLNIFSLSDAAATRKHGDFDSFAAHRLSRHAGINAFTNHAIGMSGVCTLTYLGEGHPLSVHMAESGVTTTCDLTTYEATSTDEIPFDRDSLALKTILRSSVLQDALSELASLNPSSLTIEATPSPRTGSHLSLGANGDLGSANVDFSAAALGTDASVLETFHCPTKTSASFQFQLIKAAQRAMATASKVSLRLDEEGVLSLQFLVEVESGASDGEGVAFVDFRVVPLVEDDGDSEADYNNDSD